MARLLRLEAALLLRREGAGRHDRRRGDGRTLLPARLGLGHVRALGVLPLALPEVGELFMDSGYTDYASVDAAMEADGVTFATQRKGNSRRYDEPRRACFRQLMRKQVETVFSRITAMFPRHIHAVALDGLLLKVSAFVIAFTLDKAFI